MRVTVEPTSARDAPAADALLESESLTNELPPADEPSGSSEGPLPDTMPSRGGRSAQLIQRVVKSRFNMIRKCYRQALSLDPHFRVRVVTFFVITQTGATSEVRGSYRGEHGADGDAATAKLAERMVDCVESEIGALRFPKPDGDVVPVSYPIVFAPKK